MEKALRATMGRPVRGARLSATGLETDLPLDFPTEDAAKGFRKGRTSEHMVELCQRIATANGWGMVVLSLKRAGGGKPTPALILDALGNPLHRARELWPDLTPFTG